MRLSFRLGLVFSLFGAVIAGSYHFNHVRAAKREAHARMEEMARITMTAVKAMVEARARDGGYRGLGGDINKMLKAGVASVVVIDHRGRRRVGRSTSEARKRHAHPDIPLNEVRDGFYDIEESVVLGKGRLGMVQMSFPTSELEQRLREIAEKEVRAGVMAFLSITLAAWIIGVWFGLRLERLVPKLEALPHDPARFRPLISTGGQDEVSRLVTAFNTLGTSLRSETLRRRDVEMEKKELASMLVHDLKTPLTVIHAGISLLQDQVNEDDRELINLRKNAAKTGGKERRVTGRGRRKSDPSNKRTFELLKMSADRLQRMIEDVLQLAHMEEVEGLRNQTPVDMVVMAKAAAKDFELVTADRGQKFLLDVAKGFPAKVVGDAAILRRVFDNLVHNAVEHTPSGALVRLAVGPDVTGAVRVSVSDSGPGIPPEARSEIFRKFFQREMKKHVGNVGMGLAFCRKAVERHGGFIGVEDAQPKGACFFFVLPRINGAKAGGARRPDRSGRHGDAA